jgi:hypothetical protein
VDPTPMSLARPSSGDGHSSCTPSLFEDPPIASP